MNLLYKYLLGCERWSRTGLQRTAEEEFSFLQLFEDQLFCVVFPCENL